MRVTSVLISCALVAGIVSQGHAAPLLFDDFSSNTIDPTRWTTFVPTQNYSPGGLASNASIGASNGHVNISSRAYLSTAHQFAAPISISGDVTFVNIDGGSWESQPINGVTFGENPGEIFTVADRTPVLPDLADFGEAADALRFRMSVSKPIAGQPAAALEMGIDNITAPGTPFTIGFTYLASKTSSIVHLGQGDTAHFTVTDDGTNVTFTVAQVINGIPSTTLVDSLSAVTTYSSGSNYIAFYDREAPNVGQPRSVALDNLAIDTLPEPSSLALTSFAAVSILLKRRRTRAHGLRLR